MKNFFEHQNQARKNTGWLIALFALAVILIVFAANVAALVVLAAVQQEPDPPAPIPDSIVAVQDGLLIYPAVLPAAIPDMFLTWVTGITLLLILAGTLYKINELGRGGGAAIAEMFEGKYLSHSTRHVGERTLLNVVEEMAIASGISPPKVYLVDSPGINAFAAGTTINTAVIGVTKGCLQKLSRQELQGVIAHEYSHILNGDMRTNLHLVGLLHGILLLAITGRVLIRAASQSGGRNSGKAMFFLTGLSLLLIGYIGVFFGKLIKAAVSRQREFLADATAVQYTRDPEGIHGALGKIANHDAGTYVDSPYAEEVAHLFFGNALSKRSWFSQLFGLSGLLSTHPPLEERMQRILPLKPTASPRSKKAKSPRKASQSDKIIAPLTEDARLDDSVGRLDKPLLDTSSIWMSQLAPNIQESLKSPQSSASLLLAVLLSNLNSFYREQQRLPRELRQGTPLPSDFVGDIPWEIWEQAENMTPLVEKLRQEEVLPLVDLALATLRELPVSDLRAISQHVANFQGYSNTEELDKYMVSTLIRSRLMGSIGTDPAHSVNPVAPAADLCLLLSTLAHHGHPESDQGSYNAYESGAEKIRGKVPMRGQLGNILPSNECGLYRFDKALFSLKPIPPLSRQAVLSACLSCITYDKAVKPAEKELFRAVAAVLDCPTPPNLGDSSADIIKNTP